MNSYDKKFKDKVIKEVSEVGNVALVARKYDLPKSTLQTWYLKDKRDTPEKKESDAKARKIKVLEKELAARDLENEVLKDLLKKTHQLWVSD